jgi:phage gpG-like protein
VEIHAEIKAEGLTEVARRVGTSAEEIHTSLTIRIADWLKFVIRKSFAEESTAEGAPWKPLQPRTAARKKGPGILREGGALFEQLYQGRSTSIVGDTVTIASTLPYSAAHQFGFEGDVTTRQFLHRVKSRDVWGKLLNPKLGKETRRIIARGIGHVAPHTRHMNIPARPFLPSAEFIEAEGSAIVKEATEQILFDEGLE